MTGLKPGRKRDSQLLSNSVQTTSCAKRVDQIPGQSVVIGRRIGTSAEETERGDCKVLSIKIVNRSSRSGRHELISSETVGSWKFQSENRRSALQLFATRCRGSLGAPRLCKRSSVNGLARKTYREPLFLHGFITIGVF